MTEQWRPVVGYEGLYEVSDAGRVSTTRRKGSPGGLRKLHRAKAGGYWIVALCRDGVQRTHTVHALVMAAFVGPCPEGMEVRHLDGDSANCSLNNLIYGTSSENKQDILRHGRHNMASKTHCLRGHEFTPENTRIGRVRPKRECRACQNQRNRDKRREARELRSRQKTLVVRVNGL